MSEIPRSCKGLGIFLSKYLPQVAAAILAASKNSQQFAYQWAVECYLADPLGQFAKAGAAFSGGSESKFQTPYRRELVTVFSNKEITLIKSRIET